MPSARNERILFGLLAVELEHARPAEIAQALEECAPDASVSEFADLLVKRGMKPAAREEVEQALASGDADSSSTVDATLPAGPKSAQRPKLRPQRLPKPGSPLDPELDLPRERSGRYTIRGVHGKGGQAKVMLAFDEEMTREVALKVMRDSGEPGSLPEPSSVRSTPGALRFLREAKLTAQLEHPHIIPVYEMGRRPDGALYYTMRLVRGKTLTRVLQDCSTLAERLKTLGSFSDVCNAIAYAHSKGIIHRDLKPENVMVGEFGETVLLDWGVAKIRGERDIGAGDLKRELDRIHASSDKTQAGTAVGTPAYMSPEQALGQVDDIDGRSDVWGLGAVLYEILTGKPPFKGRTPMETLDQVVNEPLVPVRKRAPDAPPELVAIAEKCLQKEKADRYQSAKEIAAEIDAFMTGGKVQAYHYSSLELLKRFYAQNRAAVIAAGLLLLVIVAALVAVTFSLKAETAARQAAQQARDKEFQQRLTANFHLAQAFAEKSDRLADDLRYLSSTVYAAASLLHNPAHPKSPFFDASFAGASPQSERTRVVAASQVFQARFSAAAALQRAFLTDEPVESVDLSPDGRHLAAAVGREVVLFDLQTGARRPLAGGHKDHAYGVAFSPDGKRLASCARDGRVVMWDLATFKPIWSVEGHTTTARAVSFCGQETLSSLGFDDQARLWVAATGEPIRSLTGLGDRPMRLDCSEGGGVLAIGSSDHNLRLFDWRTGKPLGKPIAHPDSLMAIALSPDGQQVATGGNDKVIRVFEVASGKPLQSLEGHRDGVTGVVFAPGGRRLISLSYDKTVRLWDLESARTLLAIAAHEDFPHGLSISRDGKTIATGSYDHSVKLWRLSDPPSLTLIGHTGTIYGLAFSRDGQRLVSASWDRSVRLWDVATRRATQIFHGHSGAVDGGVAIDRSGSRIASGSRDRTVRIWDASSGGQLHALAAARTNVYGVSISPDGATLASTGQDGVIRLWGLQDGALKRELKGHQGTVDRTAFSPDGKTLATAGYDKTVRLWDLATGSEVRKLEGHRDWVSGVDFSEDGKLLASSGKDNRALIFDLATGKQILELNGHSQWVNEVRFSPDAKLVATGSDDRTVRLWSARSGQELLAIRAAAEVVAVEFSPDGKTLAVGDGNDVVLYPVDFSALDADPQALLDSSQAAAGYRLDGFELRPIGEPKAP